VTTALCWHPQHEVPSRRPHEEALAAGSEVYACWTTLLAAEDEAAVRARIETTLREDDQREVRSAGSREVAACEPPLAARLPAPSRDDRPDA
jgi:hypothetical protein